MAVDEWEGRRKFYCDFCRNSAEFDSGLDFGQCWQSLKADGWQCWRDRDGEWYHRCGCTRTGKSLLDEPMRSLGKWT
jgi:hypothetical protein